MRRSPKLSSLWLLAVAGLVAGCGGEAAPPPAPQPAAAPRLPQFELSRSDEEWRQVLTPEAYAVLRMQMTEPAFTSPLATNKEPGVYHCGACGQPLFSTAQQYDSGLGWLTFTAPLETKALLGLRDTSHGMERTRMLCSRCGSHLGYLFGDGPDEPDHNRFTINGAAIVFVPEGGSLPEDFGQPRPPGESAADAAAATEGEGAAPAPAAAGTAPAPPAAEPVPAPPTPEPPPPAGG